MYEDLKQRFRQQFGKDARWIFSAPGRTEIGGNHTDHQHGRVLAAAVDLDTTAAVALNGRDSIRVLSEGYDLCEISLPVEEPDPEKFGTTSSLITGVAARFSQLGHRILGFDAYVTSRVLPGSGLSSYAAFEVLMGEIINQLFCCGLSQPEIAMAGQYAENVYFGKPCGLMDQMASAVGNIITIDFAEEGKPKVTPVPFDFADTGYGLCIIDSGASHADLTDCYAAIPAELKKVCACFGARVLREVPEEKFYADIGKVREAAGDRAVLRAIHVYEDNRRVEEQVRALSEGDFDRFLELVRESGRSSWMLLQNVIPEGRTARQEVAFALALAERLLKGRGAVRVHGGGFAGTIQAFVPRDLLESFRDGIEAVLGEGSCHVLSIRPRGGMLLEECK